LYYRPVTPYRKPIRTKWNVSFLRSSALDQERRRSVRFALGNHDVTSSEI
jgi:hypothetical protein